MKYSIIKFFAIPVIAFAGTASADIGSTDVSTQLQSTLRSCGNTPACKNLFYAKSVCDRAHSDNLGDLTTCYGQALNVYQQSVGVAAVDEPYEGEHLPVSTNTADALYEYPADGDQKGYLQAREN